VTGYDTEAPSWGQTAEQAWGGINEPLNQGIFTRDYVSGGFVWTGFDCTLTDLSLSIYIYMRLFIVDGVWVLVLHIHVNTHLHCLDTSSNMMKTALAVVKYKL
jgi:hypothetical protein